MNSNKPVVLVVDDEPINIELLVNILTPLFTVKVATRGEKAIEIANNEKLDAILLDIEMPSMSGFDVIRVLKENSKTEETPVIFITGRTDERDEELGFNLGAVDYIRKPFKEKIVKKRVATHIKIYEQERSLLLQRNFLEEQKEELETFFNVSRTSIVIIGLDTRFLKVNKAFENMLGIREKELIGKELSSIFVNVEQKKKIVKSVNEIITMGFLKSLEETIYSKNNFPISVNISASLLPDKNRILLNFVDITESKLLKEELENINYYLQDKIEEEVGKNKKLQQENFQNQKKAAMGGLISIIAHQLKQPLNAINTFSGTLLLHYENNTLTKERVEKTTSKIENSVEFMSQSIDDLRNFFRPNKESKTFSVNSSIEKALSIVEKNIFSKGIDIKKDLTEEFYIDGIISEMQQVILNIVTNAKDILIEKRIKDPFIKIETRMENDRGVLCIHDNGGGVSDDIKDKIFNAYFTTKEDKGTGLGLSLSKMIVKDSIGGKISVYNTKEGACFKIIFPALIIDKEELQEIFTSIEKKLSHSELVKQEELELFIGNMKARAKKEDLEEFQQQVEEFKLDEALEKMQSLKESL